MALEWKNCHLESYVQECTCKFLGQIKGTLSRKKVGQKRILVDALRP
jgi:hypothetical protein